MDTRHNRQIVECDECMAIRRRLSHCHCSNSTTSPGSIVYDDRFAENVCHDFRKNARLNIQATTRGTPRIHRSGFVGKLCPPANVPHPSMPLPEPITNRVRRLNRISMSPIYAFLQYKQLNRALRVSLPAI